MDPHAVQIEDSGRIVAVQWQWAEFPGKSASADIAHATEEDSNISVFAHGFTLVFDP
jgi:hypothetical protein